MNRRVGVLWSWALACLLGAPCPGVCEPAAVLKGWPLDSLNGVLTHAGVQLDRAVSSDGKGSLRVVAAGPTTVRLFEAGYLNVEDARLIYRARVRTEAAEGNVYLEMYCVFPGLGEFFSRGLDRPLTGSAEWTTLETSFFLKKGENPANVKLNLVLSGKGTVWIDEIQLLRAPLD